MSKKFQGCSGKKNRNKLRGLLHKKLTTALLLPIGGVALLATASPTLALNYEVNGTTTLAQAINAANATSSVDDTISFAAGYENVTLGGDLPAITDTVDIIGSAGVVIDGGGTYQGFRVGVGTTNAVTVNINDITIQNTKAQGGAGDAGGGGGAGLGGALFVNDNATVTVENVDFVGNNATGGAGGLGTSGGGGGTTADGNSNGNGGAATATSGQGASVVNDTSAGSGNATSSATGGNGNDGGGGGGADAKATAGSGDATATATGGDGGYGGGGGAAEALAVSDTGAATATATGGDGGYGGGGGGTLASTEIGGVVGAGTATTTAGSGGYGGGDAAGFSGGDGAGLGGAIFVREGGSLTIKGGTTINGGSVDAGGAGASAAGNGIFLNGNILTFDINGVNAEISDGIADSSDVANSAETGAGSIVKTGFDTLILSGTNTYTGTTTVDGGTLQQDGSTESAFIVNYTLDGIGNIHNSVTVNSGGSISGGSKAGSSPDQFGTLTVDSLVFSSNNALYQVRLDSTNANSKVVVVNNADLGGAQVLIDGSSTFSLGNSYNILSAGSLTGTFNSDVATGSTVLVADLSNANNQEVYLTLSTDFGGQDGTINEESMSDYLDDLADDGTLPDDVNDLIIDLADDVNTAGSLAPLDPYLGDVYSAFDQLGYWQSNRFINRLVNHLNIDQSSADWARTFALNGANGLNGVSSQMAMLRKLVASTSNGLAANGSMWRRSASENSSGAWGAIYGDRLSTEADTALGSPELSSSNKGVALGYGVSRNGLNYGLALGYHDASLDFDNRDADGDSDGWDVGLYAGKQSSDWYYNGALSFTKNSNNLTRTDISGDYNADFSSRSIAAMVEIGKHIVMSQDKNCDITTVTPYLSLLAMHYSRGDASESGPGVGLEIGDASHTYFTSTLGARFDYNFVDEVGNTTGGLMAGLSWIHQFADTDMEVQTALQGAGGSFTVWGTPLSKNALGLDLGGYGKFSENVLGFVNYHGSFGGNEKLHSVTAGLEFKF